MHMTTGNVELFLKLVNNRHGNPVSVDLVATLFGIYSDKFWSLDTYVGSWLFQ